MGIEFTRKSYMELYKDGVPVVASGRTSNRHTSLVEAAEHATEHAAEIKEPGTYEVRIDGGLYYVVKITEIVLSSAEVTPPPQVQADLTLSASSYSGNEGTNIQFTILRTLNTDERVSVDWAIVNASATPPSGTQTFELGDTQKTVTIAAGLVSPTENGTLTISNAVNLSGGLTPSLSSPSSATFTIVDTTEVTPV